MPDSNFVTLRTTISGLFCYPVKSCAGHALSTALVEAQGIRHDRRWLVVDGEGRFLTQREHGRMAQIHPTVDANNDLTLAHNNNDLPALHVPCVGAAEGAILRQVTIWRDTCAAYDQGDAVAQWLGAILQMTCRLVWMPDTTHRPIHWKDKERRNAVPNVSFADAFPLLVTTEESLADLNRRIAERSTGVPAAALAMERFRPNIVIRGSLGDAPIAPYAEHTWQMLITAAGQVLHLATACARCAIPTLDPATGSHTGPEPLATLATYRRSEGGKVLFGVNAAPGQESVPITLHVGEQLTVTPIPLPAHES